MELYQTIQSLVKHHLRVINRDTSIVYTEDQWIRGKSIGYCNFWEMPESECHGLGDEICCCREHLSWASEAQVKRARAEARGRAVTYLCLRTPKTFFFPL